MKPRRRSILSMLDDSVRWTGMPDRVANQMAGGAFHEPQRLRWTPIWPIAFSLALLMTSLAWPPALDGIDLGFIICALTVFWCCVFGMMPGIHAIGPLGKSSMQDDEREAALRKNSYLVCLGLLAAINCLCQPVFMVLSHWQDWKLPQIVSVVTSVFILNAALFGCLPTLYASWKLRQLPE
jgi:hypothetical protein